jgi:hypothetical protein
MRGLLLSVWLISLVKGAVGADEETLPARDPRETNDPEIVKAAEVITTIPLAFL